MRRAEVAQVAFVAASGVTQSHSPPTSAGAPSTPQQVPPPAQQAAACDFEWASFTHFLRVRRASDDHIGLCFQAVFNLVMLLRWWPDLATPHRLYLIATIEACLVVLAWRRLCFSSYAGWRDWVQICVRIILTLSPANYAVWKLLVQVEPPDWVDSMPQWLGSLAMAPLVLNSMLVPHVLALGFAHPLPLWTHALLHSALAVFIAGDLGGGCGSPFTSHPACTRVVEECVGLFHLLTFRGFFGAGTSLNRGHAWECRHAALMLQLLAGLLTSLAAQAASDASALPAFKRWQRQHSGQAAAAHWQQGACCLHDRACDFLSKRLLVRVAAAVRQPAVWAVVAVLLWNAVVLLLP